MGRHRVRPGAGFRAVIVHVDYVPRRAPEGTAALQRFAAGTRKDDGSLRVEIVQEPAQPMIGSPFDERLARPALAP